MINLIPFLLFDGDCAEAMTFYQSCLGGELTLTKMSDTPMKDQMPPELHQKIVHASLKNATIEFKATDWMHPVRKPKKGNTVCMYITGGNYNELKQIFNNLSQGADKDLLDDLREMPFGIYGHLADKFGVHWFFNGDTKSMKLK